MTNFTNKLKEAAELIKHSSRTTTFTGAGISVESGIPPFRGENGLWSKFDPVFLDIDLSFLPPRCPYCKTVLKPDFVFFGEPIPEPAKTNSFSEDVNAELFILIGTTGEIMPASLIPYEAKKNGKKIIEINIAPSNYTNTITDIFLQGEATKVVPQLIEAVLRNE